MSAKPAIRPTAYNKLGQRTQTQSAPLARERFLSSDTDATRVRQLENQVRALSVATDAARAQPTARIVECVFQNDQDQDVYVHNFGRQANWRIVDWRPNTAGLSPVFYSVPNPNEANVLRIHCGANAGTVKIEVF